MRDSNDGALRSTSRDSVPHPGYTGVPSTLGHTPRHPNYHHAVSTNPQTMVPLAVNARILATTALPRLHLSIQSSICYQSLTKFTPLDYVVDHFPLSV